jgi:hypothetical protein
MKGVESRPDWIGGRKRQIFCLLYNIYSLEGVESRPDRIVGGEDRFFGLSSIQYLSFGRRGEQAGPDSGRRRG